MSTYLGLLHCLTLDQSCRGRIDVAREASEGGSESGPGQALRDAVIILLKSVLKSAV